MAKSKSDDLEETVCQLQAEFCKGMAHPKRIFILRLLKDGEKTVNEIADLAGIPQTNLSQHLALMRQLGLLNARRDGPNVYYGIADRRVVEACELVRGAIREKLRKSSVVLEGTL